MGSCQMLLDSIVFLCLSFLDDYSSQVLCRLRRINLKFSEFHFLLKSELAFLDFCNPVHLSLNMPWQFVCARKDLSEKWKFWFALQSVFKVICTTFWLKDYHTIFVQQSLHLKCHGLSHKISVYTVGRSQIQRVVSLMYNETFLWTQNWKSLIHCTSQN